MAVGRFGVAHVHAVEAELVVGNVKDKPLSEIWAGTEIDALIESHERGEYADVGQRCTYFVSVYNSRKSRTFEKDGTPAGNWAED